VLSLVLPIPMVALLVLSRRPAVMGAFVAGRVTSMVALAAAGLTLSLNLVLLVQIWTG
jgi:manganese transport protein